MVADQKGKSLLQKMEEAPAAEARRAGAPHLASSEHRAAPLGRRPGPRRPSLAFWPPNFMPIRSDPKTVQKPQVTVTEDDPPKGATTL